jgi:hypothetical protein
MEVHVSPERTGWKTTMIQNGLDGKPQSYRKGHMEDYKAAGRVELKNLSLLEWLDGRCKTLRLQEGLV